MYAADNIYGILKGQDLGERQGNKSKPNINNKE